MGRVLSTAPQPGTGWPMARALDLSQLGCPGLSPPCSSWIPCCTPHRSCRLASYSPQLGFGKPTPAPHALLGSQEHSQGTQATWARRVLPGKPCLSGSGPGSPPTSFLLPLRGCIAPASPRLPLGVFPTRGPHPPQDSLVEPPTSTPRVFAAFSCQAQGNVRSWVPKPGFMACPCFTPGLGGTDSTPISQLEKTGAER